MALFLRRREVVPIGFYSRVQVRFNEATWNCVRSTDLECSLSEWGCCWARCWLRRMVVVAVSRSPPHFAKAAQAVVAVSEYPPRQGSSGCRGGVGRQGSFFGCGDDWPLRRTQHYLTEWNPSKLRVKKKAIKYIPNLPLP